MGNDCGHFKRNPQRLVVRHGRQTPASHDVLLNHQLYMDFVATRPPPLLQTDKSQSYYAQYKAV